MYTYQPTPDLKITNDVYRTSLPGLLYLPHHSFPDERGFYAEVARIPEIEKVLGREFRVKQINHSRSKKNVVRGFHAEVWNKLITITAGRVFCVLVDVRPNSPTFGKSEKFILGFDQEARDETSGSGEGAQDEAFGSALHGAIFVSSGIANGFGVLEGSADYLYVVDELYKNRDRARDQAIALFDPDIDAHWPILKKDQIFSKRDQNAKTLRELFPEKF